MGVLTTLLKLLKPGENDYYNQQTEQADNWQKVDDYAVLTNADKNGIWGGEFGGYIQDPIPKELNKRYIDNINGKAFICIKAGDSTVTSNTTEYFTPCNVVDNLKKVNDYLNYYIGGYKTSNIEFFSANATSHDYRAEIQLPKRYKRIHNVILTRDASGTSDDVRNVYWDKTVDTDTDKLYLISTNIQGDSDPITVRMTVIAEI